MKHSLLKLPFIENRFIVLTNTTILSILLHGILLIGFSSKLLFQENRQIIDPGIIVEVETIQINDELHPPAKVIDKGMGPIIIPKDFSSHIRKDVRKEEKNKTEPNKSSGSQDKIRNRRNPEKEQKSSSQNNLQTSPNQVKPITSLSSLKIQPPFPESHNPKPNYPHLARKRGQEGIVQVQCEIDANGKILKIGILKSSGFKLLDEEALKTVTKWKFKPAKKNEIAVPGSIIVPVHFKLK